jgi:hypothetical protein
MVPAEMIQIYSVSAHMLQGVSFLYLVAGQFPKDARKSDKSLEEGHIYPLGINGIGDASKYLMINGFVGS